MQINTNKQNMGWGILLICFGISIMTDMYIRHQAKRVGLPISALSYN